mgnify:CR=1 FL=1
MKKYLAEFLGTMFLVILGCGVAVSTNVNVVATSLAFGLAIVGLAYGISSISGCHVNPAVSLGMALTKKMSWKDFAGYLVAQFLGALVGAALLAVMFKGTSALGANSANGNVGIAFLVETLLTYLFVGVVLFVTSKKENGAVAGIVIGLTLTLVHLLGLGFTGTSVNPARSFGPALLQGGAALGDLWIFILAPSVGAVLAALTYKYFTSKK